jgi:hypothetical protein
MSWQKNLSGMVVYFSTQIGTPGKTVGTMFAPVQVEITSYEPEKVGGNIFSLLKGPNVMQINFN